MSNEIVPLYGSSSSPWKYDVFLSFRGEDTRNNFTSHLYNAFKRRVTVYKDDKDLERGKHIASELLQAIEESQISIIVLSKDYASSTWCLDELEKIVQCRNSKGQNVFPIFYDVDPSMVRKQTGAFQEAFVKHEENFQENKEKVQNWRDALTYVGSLSGWHAKNRDESELIEDIIEKITCRLKPTKLMIFKDLVGIKSRLEELIELIGTGNDIRIIGICGMGGIGKTTMARVVYDLISSQFEGSSFLANVRETSEKKGLVPLQQQLLLDMLKGRDNNIFNMYDGMEKIMTMLRYKKVLVVVDDVTCIEQLNALIGRRDWFGPGSRIMITTRDEHLLIIEMGVDSVYKAKELNDDDAQELFSLKAFKNFQPANEYVGLSKHFVKYAGGLPLALEVLGSFVCGRPIHEWKDALERLERDSMKGILDRLQISFDGLEEREKKIFLDVACFFNGKDKDHVIKILDGCGFSSRIGISLLIEQSLIKILESNELRMHDLLEAMGKQIVKRESPKEPGRRSRLWEEDDIHHVLTNNSGTEVVEGIILSSSKKKVRCHANVFSKMINLRILKISGVELVEGRLDYLSSKLRLLDWSGYPLESFPPNLQLDKVVELNLDRSLIKQLSKEIKPLNMLTSISFKGCQYLKETPDFTYAPKLKEVILEGCKSLCQIHPSLLLHENIWTLNMKFCTCLTTLGNKIHMKNLQTLELSSCSKLKDFPDIVGSMDDLWELDLSDTAIKELPLSVGSLSELVVLSLKNCKNLVGVPNTINGLNSLAILDFSGCSKLHNFLEILGQAKSLTMLSLPSLCTSLEELDLSDCHLGDGAMPSDFFDNFHALSSLALRNNNFVSFSVRISHLSRLEYLDLSNCKRLQSLPELPSNIESVYADDCASLETLSNSLSLCNWKLSRISFGNCFKLIGSNSMAFFMLREHLNKAVPNLTEILRDRYGCTFSILVPGSGIPEWFSHPSKGRSIRIERPAYFRNSKLLGLLVGFVFCAQRHPPVGWNGFYSLSCSFSPGYKHLWANELGEALLDHLLLLYIPKTAVHNLWEGSKYGGFEFWGQAVEVKECGVHPIYEEDVEEFNKIDNQSSVWNVTDCNGNINRDYAESQTERLNRILSVQGLWA